jgi:hypothetical protein
MSGYEPIPTEELPARYAGIFAMLTTGFAPPNGNTTVRTITGQPLELVCETIGSIKKSEKKPVIHPGYQKAIWDLKNGHLRYCPSQDTLWRRDPDIDDHDGPRRILNSWHPVKTIEDEYSIGSNSQSNDRKPAYSDTIIREAKRSQWFPQVERGIRIGDTVYVRRNGHITHLVDDELAVTQTFDPTGLSEEAISKAQEYCHWLTNDDSSYLNLLRLFATPWLEPFKQLSYVLSGHGGDGKTLIMQQIVLGMLSDRRVFPGFKISDYCGRSGFGFAREGMNDAMDGKAFAYEDEAPTVTEDMLAPLRALSTGSRMQARVTGGKYRTIKPTATIVILTNNPFADSSEPSDRRRFVKIEMHSSEGRSYSQYHEIELFAREHAVAFYVLSCGLWEQGDDPEIVNLTSARSVSDEMYWIISEINENSERYDDPAASSKKFRDEFHHQIPDSTLNLLGLAQGTSRKLDGKRIRVVRVVDRQRFDIYAKTIIDESGSEPLVSADVVASLPEPIEADPLPLPGEFMFRCAYTPADANKVARNWKKLSQDPQYDSTILPDTAAYAVVPGLGMSVIDMDKAKEDGIADGWTTLNTQIGQYGSDVFPSTYLVGTPSGGVHAYYALPLELLGKLKNSVHNHGIPVDIRCENKGYVIGPGSHTDKGEYQLLDMPADGSVPVMTPRMVQWLESNGYVDGVQPSSPTIPVAAAPVSAAALPSVDEIIRGDPISTGDGNPDMTPIPEGQRNTTLFNWALGRLLNHRDNESAIRYETFQRGHLSGLGDAELTTLWNSVLTTVQQHR